MKSFKLHLDETKSIKSLVNKLKNNKKVVDLIKHKANLTAAKLGAALLAIPVVKSMLTSPDKMNKATMLGSSLKSVILGEENITEAPVKIKARLGRAVSAGGHGSGRFAGPGHRGDEKGWAHKSGKIIVWKGMKPFHIQYIVKNLSKFGLKEKEVLDVLEARFDSSFGSPDPKEDAKKYLQELIAGTPYDRDPSIEYLAMKKGWCRVVLGKFSSIGGYNIQTIHQVAKQIDKKKGWTKGIKSLELWEYGESNGSIKKGNVATTKMAGSLDNAYDIGIWADGGNADPQNVGRGRTEIGRTMAQFREWIELTEKAAKLSSVAAYKGAKWEDFRGLENPTEKEMVSLMKKSSFKELRFVVDSKGKMWAWDTNDSLHEPVVYAMTGKKYDGDYAKGMINFMTANDLDDLDPDMEAVGNLHVMILNSRLGTKFALKNRTLKALAKRINSKGKDRVWWKDA